MSDPTIRVHLKSGKTFTFLWGDPLDNDLREDYESHIESARAFIRDGNIISGWFGSARDKERWTEIDPQSVEAVESIQ